MTVENKNNLEISKEQALSLRLGLKVRLDIKRLGEAVYEAEALDSEGKLPIDLIETLTNARKYYDELRIEQGEKTTAMRVGNLQSRYDALQKIQECVILGHKYIYDSTTQTNRPIVEVLREAERLFAEASDDSAQYELNFASKNEQMHPRYALERLKKALQEPFTESCLHKLNEKYYEIQSIVNVQEKAEETQSNALQKTDTLERFAGILNAYKIFQYIPGLSEQLEQTRHIAVSILITQIRNSLRYTEVLLGNLDLETARKQIQDSGVRVSSWPEQEKPREIHDLSVELELISRQFLNIEQSWREYIHYAEIIRSQIINSDKRAIATQLFHNIIQDSRFQNFPDLRILKMEVENYSNLGEQLAIAKSAYAQSDWSKTIGIANSVLTSGMAGQLANEFHDLQNDAQLELDIQMLYNKIFAEDYKEARYLLSRILATQDENERNRLESRLSSEIRFLKEKTGF